jgi:hypothetical protein
LSGGVCLTAGSLSHHSDIGYCGTVGIEFQPDPTNSPELELVLRGAWRSFSLETNDDLTVKSVELDIKLNYALFRSPNLFIVGGGGMAQVESGVKETGPIASLGLGIERGSLLVESRFSRVFGDHFKETSFFPITVGLTF